MSNGILKAVEEIEREMVGDVMLIGGEERDILDAKAFCRDATGDLVAYSAAIPMRGPTPEPSHIAVEIEGKGFVHVSEIGEKLESGEWEEPQ